MVSITGEIIQGDLESFKAAVKAANDIRKLVTSLRLNSPGGNILEGDKLADDVRFAKLATKSSMPRGALPPCFLIFAAGETEFADYYCANKGARSVG